MNTHQIAFIFSGWAELVYRPTQEKFRSYEDRWSFSDVRVFMLNPIINLTSRINGWRNMYISVYVVLILLENYFKI